MRRHAPRPRRNPRPALAFEPLEPRVALAGNILVSGYLGRESHIQGDPTIREFRPDGIQLDQMPGGTGGDLAIDPEGTIQRYSSIDWYPQKPPASYPTADPEPTIAVSGHFAFVTRGVGPFDLPGIIRYDTLTGELTPFEYHNEAKGLTVGQDGYLYARQYDRISRFDPTTLEKLGSIQDAAFLLQSRLAVDASGNIYSFSGESRYHYPDAISKFGPGGDLLSRFSLDNLGFDASMPTDLELDPSGELWASFGSGAVARLSGDLSGLIGWFDSGLTTPYLAMAGVRDNPPPPPSTFSIADAPSVIEGDSGVQTMEFEVTRTGDLSRPASVNYTIIETSNLYHWTTTQLPRMLDFQPGQATAKVTWYVPGDTRIEGDEPIRIRLSDPFRGQIGRGEAKAIVIDDDPSPNPSPLPTLTVSNPTVTEGEDAAFVLTISRPFNDPVRIRLWPVDGTATYQDYTSNLDRLTVTFAPGETSKTVRVPTVADDIAESDETFSVVASAYDVPFSYVNNGVAVATIRERPAPPFALSGDIVPEGDGEMVAATARFKLASPPGRVLTADYKIEAYDAAGRIDPMVPATFGRVTFQPGDTERAVAFRTAGDRVYSGRDPVYRLTITRADSAILQGAADLRFREDDPAPFVLDSISAVEGDEGVTFVRLRVLSMLAKPTDGLRHYRLIGNSAGAGSDFIPIPDEVVEFDSVTQTGYVGLRLLGDRVPEAAETFTIELIPEPAELPRYQADPGPWRATFTIVDDDPAIMPRALAPVAGGEAVDSDLDGIYESVRVGSNVLRIERDASGHSAALLEFDVSGVLLSETPDARFKFWIPQFDAGSGEVTITGRPGDGDLTLDDALAPGAALGRFTPDSLGARTVTLDRNTIAALTRGSRWLSLRLDLGDGHGRTGIFLDGRGLFFRNGTHHFQDYSTGLVYDRTAQITRDDTYETVDQRPVLLPMMDNDALYIDGSNRVHVENGPKSGVLNWTAEGITYTARPGFFGTDSFTYTIGNSAHQEFSQPATVTILVAHVNRPPVVENPTFVLLHAIRYDDSLRGDVRDEDGPAGPTFRLVTPPSHGKVTIQPDGRFVYVAIRNYYGVDTFQFRADDSLASGAIGTASMMVTSNLEPLLLRPDTFSVDEDRTLSPAASVLDNDSLWVTDGVRSVEVVDGPKHGSLTLGQDGRFLYKPARDYSGSDTFSYQVRLPVSLGGAIVQGPATVTIQVRPVNDAPVAVGEAFSLNEDTRLVLNAPGLLRNDTDVDSKSLRPVLVGQPLHGKVVVDPSGSFIYVPVKDYSGPDRFTYRVSDGWLASNLATVTLTVRPVDDAPVAAPDAYVVGITKTWNVAGRGVLANDRDAEGAPLVAPLIAPPPAAAGRLIFRKDGTFTFVPKAKARGTFTFTYRVSDGKNPSAPATVSLTVGAPTIKRARSRVARRPG